MTPSQPKDPAYEARVRETFNRQPHMATLGATIAFIAPGELHIALPYAARFTQQNGFMHAGAIAIAPNERTLVATMLSTIIIRPTGPA